MSYLLHAIHPLFLHALPVVGSETVDKKQLSLEGASEKKNSTQRGKGIVTERGHERERG